MERVFDCTLNSRRQLQVPNSTCDISQSDQEATNLVKKNGDDETDDDGCVLLVLQKNESHCVKRNNSNPNQGISSQIAHLTLQTASCRFVPVWARRD